MKIRYKIKEDMASVEAIKRRLECVPHVTAFRRTTLQEPDSYRTVVIRTKVGLSADEREIIRESIRAAFIDILEDIDEFMKGQGSIWIIRITLREGFKVTFGKDYIEIPQIYEG